MATFHVLHDANKWILNLKEPWTTRLLKLQVQLWLKKKCNK